MKKVENLRLKGNEGLSMKDQIEDSQSGLTESIQSLFEEQELFAKVIEHFPINSDILSRRYSKDD